MSQFQAPPPPIGSGLAPEPAKTSALAVISLVCSLALCVPFLAPLVGLVFGIAALSAIGRSNGRMKGRGLAVAGIIVSIGGLLLHSVAGIATMVGLKAMGHQAQVVEVFISDLEEQDFESARLCLASASLPTVTDGQLAEFGDSVKSEYGTLSSVSFDILSRGIMQEVQSRQGMWNPMRVNTAKPGEVEMQIPIKLEFTNGTAYGVALLVMDAGGPVKSGQNRIKSLKIMGAEGKLTFPPESAEDETESDSDDSV